MPTELLEPLQTDTVDADEFTRVRIGVGKPPSKERGADHVLSRVSKREREAMDVTIEEAADAVERIVTDGVDAQLLSEFCQLRPDGRCVHAFPRSRSNIR